jgi:hypothetical protein
MEAVGVGRFEDPWSEVEVVVVVVIGCQEREIGYWGNLGKNTISKE